MSTQPASARVPLPALIAVGAWIMLLALCVAWEWLLAPLRPGGSWLVLKAAPLLLPLRGLLRGNARSFQWALLLVLAYVGEAAVRIAEPARAGTLAAAELGLSLVFFACAIVYLRRFKRAARAAME